MLDAIHEQREAADAMLLGRVTFEDMRGYQGKGADPDPSADSVIPYGAWQGPRFVCTAYAPESAAPGCRFVRGDVASARDTAKTAHQPGLSDSEVQQ